MPLRLDHPAEAQPEGRPSAGRPIDGIDRLDRIAADRVVSD
jgi:hypothetical protein